MNKDKIILGTFIAVILALYAAATFQFLTAEAESRFLYLLIIGVPAGAALLLFPRAALIVLTVLSYSVRWAYDTFNILPRETIWLTDILILLLLIRTLVSIFSRNEPLNKIEKITILFVIFAGLTSFINGISKDTFIVGGRMAFRYLMLFIAVCHLSVTTRFLKGYIALLFVIALLQLPVIAAQFAEMGWASPDFISGTFGRGGTTGMGLFLTVLAAYLIAWMLEHQHVSLPFIFLIILLSIPPFFGEIKFYYLFLPVVFLFMIRSRVLRRPLMGFALVVLAIGFIMGVDYLVVKKSGWAVGRNPITMLFNISGIYEHEMTTAESGRYDRAFVFSKAISLGFANKKTGLLGRGTGSATDSYAFGTDSGIRNELYQWRMTSSTAMGVIWLFVEYGIAGLVIIFFLLWLIFRRGRVLLASEDIQHRILGRLLEAMTLGYAVWNLYGPAWQLESVSFGFWPLAGLIVGLSYRFEADRKRSAQLQAEASTVMNQK